MPNQRRDGETHHIVAVSLIRTKESGWMSYIYSFGRTCRELRSTGLKLRLIVGGTALDDLMLKAAELS